MSVSLAAAGKQALGGVPLIAVAAVQPRLWTAEAVGQDDFELSGTKLHFTSEREIYAEGDEARSFYKVLSGVTRTCRFLNDGRRRIEAFHVAGDVFGLEAGSVHQLTAEAVSDCVVMAYRRRGFEAMVTQDDRLGHWFFAHVLTSLARLREHSMLLARASASQKIATFLLEMAAQDGHGGSVELPMSRQDIADYLGLTIETVSRTLSQMDRDGTIDVSTARRIMLKDRRALHDLAA